MKKSNGHEAGPHVNPLSSKFKTSLEAALYWFRFGLSVIPVLLGTKKTAVKWDPWLVDLSEEKIIRHWEKHPDHEVGFIVGDNMIVFDADSPEAVKALWDLEKAFGVPPKLVSETSKGEHHFFKLAPGVFAKSDSHSTEKNPERVDVKTGRGLILLPPSTGKSTKIDFAEKAEELTELEQAFVDALFIHNGRSFPRPQRLMSPEISDELPKEALTKISALLELIDPDSSYEEWFQGLTAIHHESNGSDEGLDLADAWSSRGAKYKGRREIETKWQSLRTDIENPITIRTLCKRVKAAGRDWMSIVSEAEAPFDVIKNDTEEGQGTSVGNYTNPLERHSLTGRSNELEKQVQDEIPILGRIALSGQMTILYAAPNTGKTLLAQHMIIESIEKKLVDPNMVFYLNVDDTGPGLLEKVRIAELYGFHMLSEGYFDFKAVNFLRIVRELIDCDQASGVTIILDTLKKFVDLMHKSQCSDFTKILRSFVLKGGSIIALAHTNKKKDSNQQSVYAGTSDFVDDSDCVYIIDTVTSSTDSGDKVIEFWNKKRRGNVVERVAYSYDNNAETSYIDRLLSVQLVDEQSTESIKNTEQIKSDAEVISAIANCIKEGTITKMAIVKEAGKQAGVSRKDVIRAIERYTGKNTGEHQWSYVVKERGRQEFYLLNDPEDTTEI